MVERLKHLIQKITALVLLFLSFETAIAQKLPNKQETSVWLPSNFKIDGKATEWDGHFQAYNHANDVFYTLANDDENLYLVVYAPTHVIISKIMSEGLTFILKKNQKEDKSNNISISYPIFETKPYFNLKKNTGEDTSVTAQNTIMLQYNNLLDKYAKWIKVTGLPNLDTLISVYNDDGIKAAGAFDNKKTYTCEISISLKLMGISAKNTSTVSYSIRINGLKPIGVIKPFGVVPGAEEKMAALANSFNESQDRLSAPTYFWGEYRLAKKP